ASGAPALPGPGKRSGGSSTGAGFFGGAGGRATRGGTGISWGPRQVYVDPFLSPFGSRDLGRKRPGAVPRSGLLSFSIFPGDSGFYGAPPRRFKDKPNRISSSLDCRGGTAGTAWYSSRAGAGPDGGRRPGGSP